MVDQLGLMKAVQMGCWLAVHLVDLSVDLWVGQSDAQMVDWLVGQLVLQRVDL